jgi:hypothetical protein
MHNSSKVGTINQNHVQLIKIKHKPSTLSTPDHESMNQNHAQLIKNMHYLKKKTL